MHGKRITVIGVPIALGADMSGADLGPGAIRGAGLMERLRQLGHDVSDDGDIAVAKPPDYGEYGPKLKYLSEIGKVCEELRNRVAAAMSANRFPLVLGGDHSIAFGSIAGVLSFRPRLGVIWMDAHADLNRAETSPTGNIHGMSFAIALGIGHPKLVSVLGQGRRIEPARAVLVGARSIDPGERELVRELGIRVFTMEDIDRLGAARVMEEAIAIASGGTDGVHLSCDLDSLDPEHAPGVGTPAAGGMTFREVRLAMEMLHDAGCAVSADFVEVNPLIDTGNKTAQAAASLAAALLGERFL